MNKYIVVATNNSGKLLEIKQILKDVSLKSLKDIGLDIDVVEDGSTFKENAYKKAYEISKLTGMTTIADDSGLLVEALGNEPGVYSKRYSGNDATDKKNNEKLLENMKKLKNRNAKFVCSICVYNPDGTYYFAQGECRGKIIDKEIGDNGFGYDPIFFIPELNKTFAQLEDKEKNEISHRGKALRKLKHIFEEYS